MQRDSACALSASCCALGPFRYRRKVCVVRREEDPRERSSYRRRSVLSSRYLPSPWADVYLPKYPPRRWAAYGLAVTPDPHDESWESEVGTPIVCEWCKDSWCHRKPMKRVEVSLKPFVGLVWAAVAVSHGAPVSGVSKACDCSSLALLPLGGRLPPNSVKRC